MDRWDWAFSRVLKGRRGEDLSNAAPRRDPYDYVVHNPLQCSIIPHYSHLWQFDLVVSRMTQCDPEIVIVVPNSALTTHSWSNTKILRHHTWPHAALPATPPEYQSLDPDKGEHHRENQPISLGQQIQHTQFCSLFKTNLASGTSYKHDRKPSLKAMNVYMFKSAMNLLQSAVKVFSLKNTNGL